MRRYLVFTEFDPVDEKALIEKDAMMQVERATYPEKHPRYVMTTSQLMADLPKLTERVRIVDVYEADSPEQMMNNAAYWRAQMRELKSYKRWYIPLQEASEAYFAEYSHQLKLAQERKEQSKTTQ